MQRYIFKRSGLDSVGGGSLISYLEVTGSAALIASLNHFCIYSKIPQPRALFLQPNCSLNSIPVEVEFLAWARRTLRPFAKMLRNQLQAWIPHLSASPTEGLNSLARLFGLTKTDERKIVGKLQRLANMKLTIFGVVRWSGTISFDERQQIDRPNHWSSF